MDEARITVSGTVKSIAFKFSIKHFADEYNITGFVRNLTDRTVEIVAQGSWHGIESMLTDIRETNKPTVVNWVQIEKRAVTDKHEIFNVIYDNPMKEVNEAISAGNAYLNQIAETLDLYRKKQKRQQQSSSASAKQKRQQQSSSSAKQGQRKTR